MDTASPYEASYDINASGLYEVYAVASDDDGNDITSTVQRIKVNEAEDTEDILTVSSDSTVTRGSVAEVSATFVSPGGIGYTNADAHVYVDGIYAGTANKLPYTPPAAGQEDQGQQFAFSLAANFLGDREIEFIIFNGSETASAKTTIFAEESPLSDDLKFLEDLWRGLYDRNPTGSELGRYYLRLQSGDLSRTQLIEELRSRAEFIKARDILVAQKSLEGEWGTVANVAHQRSQPLPFNECEWTTR